MQPGLGSILHRPSLLPTMLVSVRPGLEGARVVNASTWVRLQAWALLHSPTRTQLMIQKCAASLLTALNRKSANVHPASVSLGSPPPILNLFILLFSLHLSNHILKSGANLSNEDTKRKHSEVPVN